MASVFKCCWCKIIYKFLYDFHSCGSARAERAIVILTDGVHGSFIALPPSNYSYEFESTSYLRTHHSQPASAQIHSPPLEARAAQLRVCADGGANRVFDEMPLLLSQEHTSHVRTRFKPDVLKGDMDSIRKEVLEFYTNMGTKVINESHDQDTTDLHKCVNYISDLTTDCDKSKLCILVVGALGGRFDHEMANINVLCRFSAMRIVLFSDDCFIHLLPKTHHHEICIQPSVEGPHCGLIPIGMPSRATTTTGLEWNLNDTEMRFGSLVSTSNIVKGEEVTVQSDIDLLWTISIKRF